MNPSLPSFTKSLLFCFLFVSIFACSKEDKDQDVTDFYFQCTIDGKTFMLDKYAANASGNKESFNASAEFGIAFAASQPDCSTSKACYSLLLKLNEEKIGVFTPQVFELIMPFGQFQPAYLFTPDEPAPASMRVVITSYKASSINNPGFVAGKFTGTVIKRIPDDPSQGIPFEIAGEFAAPVVQ